MKLISTILLLLLFFFSYSQIEIKGIIIDSFNNPIDFANVVLTNKENKIIVGSISSETGSFKFNVKEGNYNLTISFISYDDWIKDISIIKNIDLGKIILVESENTLNEVTIKSKKPTLIKKVDRIEFNIENTILSEGDAWEVLNKTPGVIASSTGLLQIFGKSGILVMIDERAIQLSAEDLKNLLEGMSASEIKSIEVITNPPAKYDAEGNGIINITLKKKKSIGYNANITSRYSQGVFAKFNNGTSITYRGDKINTSINYNFGKGKKNVLENSDINFLNSQDNVFSSWNESSDRNIDYLLHNFRVSLDYYISEESILGIKFDGNITPKQQTTNNTITKVFGSNIVLDSLFINKNKTNKEKKILSYNVNFQQNFKKEGQTLVVDFDYIDYNNEGNQDVNTDFFDENNNFERNEFFTSLNEQDIQIYSSKIDYSQPIDSTTNIETGVKFNTIRTNNDLVYLNRDNSGLLIFDDNRSNQFIYDEEVYATYFSYKKDFKNLFIKLGLRAEYTKTVGKSITLNQINNNDYFQVFPSVFFQYQMKNRNSLGLTYSRRVKRPNYSLLNPFQFFSSPYSFIEGNPSLQPSFSDNIEFSYKINKNFLTFYFTHTKDPFTQLSIQDNENQTFSYNAVNLDSDLVYGIFFVTSFDVTDWWQCYFNFDAYYNEFEFIAPEFNEPVKNSKWITTPYLWNQFSISKKHNLSLELIAQYYSPRVQGGFNIKARSEVSLGVKKKLFKKKVTLSIYVADIFDQNNFTLESNYGLQNHIFRENTENQYVRFSFNYNFGNNKIKSRKRKDGSKKEKNRL